MEVNSPVKNCTPLLITGCARSGTGYASLLFKKMGLDIGHEEYGADGISSWLFAVDAENVPWGPSRKDVKFGKVFHQVRHPLKAIGSIYTYEPEESFSYTSQHIPS